MIRDAPVNTESTVDGRAVRLSGSTRLLFLHPAAFAVLAACLALSYGLTALIRAETENDYAKDFKLECDELKLIIDDRFALCEQVLHAGSALFASSSDVTEKEWANFADSMLPDRDATGIEGLGYAAYLPPEPPTARLERMRSPGLADYGQAPSLDGFDMAPVAYIASRSGNEDPLRGFDLFGDPAMRFAMESARDGADSTLAAGLLTPSGNDEVFIFYPVYERGEKDGSTDERRSSLHGWVFVRFGMERFLDSIVRTWRSEAAATLRIRLYEGILPVAANLLYDNHPETPAPRGEAPSRYEIGDGDRSMLYVFSRVGEDSEAIDYGKAGAVQVSGAIISALAWLLTILALGTRNRAKRIAERLTSSLRTSEEKYRALVDLGVDGIVVAALDGRILDANARFCEMAGRSRAEILEEPSGMRLFDAESLEKTPARFDLVLEGGTVVSQRALRKPDGERVEVEMRTKLMPDGTIQSAFNDITERLEHERKAGALLSERELLLKEVHHRIKNNMTSIESLLHLQAETSGAEPVAAALTEACGRVRCMQLLYDKLYRSSDFATVSSRDYFSDLADNIIEALPPKPGVRIETRFDDIKSNVELLLPLGIIMNELATNAWKYAFPEGREGALRLGFENLDNGTCRVSVSDDGVGMPAANGSGGFGFTLVSALVKQIGGSLRAESGGGTGFTITFPMSDRT